jgi:hypothetical protein
MNIKLKNAKYQNKARTGFPLLGLCILLLSACSTTQKVAVNQSDVNCAFLANDCALLSAGGENQADLRFINPAAQWTQYNKILLDPVTFWAGDSTPISTSDQQMLVNYFFQQLNPYLTHTINIYLKTICCALKNLHVALHLEK